MFAKVRPHLSYANVMATIAVFVALGGSSYAALQITGKQVKNSSLTGADIKNRSLGAVDFRRNELPRGLKGDPGPKGDSGPKGDAGPKGDPGAKGDPGTVDTARFYDKPAADTRFLGIGATAADAQMLGGSAPSTFRARAVHDERPDLAYAVDPQTVLRSVTVELEAQRDVLLIGTGEVWSSSTASAACRFFIGLNIDGTTDLQSLRGETAPAIAPLSGYGTATTTTLKTLGPGTHTVRLRGDLLDANPGCNFMFSSLDAVVLDG
jgi:hypothetical protein